MSVRILSKRPTCPATAHSTSTGASRFTTAAFTLLVALTATSPGTAAVFGTDDRGPVPSTLARQAANVGTVLDEAGARVCTAFCVGKRTIATAAHCLVRKGETAITRPHAFKFELARPAADGKSIAIDATSLAEPSNSERGVVAGSPTLRLKPPIDSAGDWALAHLEKPICSAGGLRLSTQSPGSLRGSYAARRAVNLAFHKDRAHAGILAAGDCGLGQPIPELSSYRIAREFSRPGDLLMHTCDTAGGASGSPILVDGAYGPEVVGINVGTYVQSMSGDVRSVATSNIASAVANTAAGADQVALALADFDAEELVVDAGSLTEFEILLAAANPRRSAKAANDEPEPLAASIIAYQRRSGLPPTGIASRELLQRLRDEAQSPAAATLIRLDAQETRATR